MTTKSKRVTSRPEGRADRYVLRDSDYELIVSYLEDPENFAALYGSGRKTKVGGKFQTKTTAFGVMAVQLQSLGFPPCTAKNLYKKVNRYKVRYETALSMLKETGGGLTDEDINRGLTIEDKLNKACPFFNRMDALFGTKANIVPPATCELGIPGVQAIELNSDEEGFSEEETGGDKMATETPTLQEVDETYLNEKSVPDSQAQTLETDPPKEQTGSANTKAPDSTGQSSRCVTGKRPIEAKSQPEDTIRSLERKKQPKVKGNLQSVIVEEMRKKDEFRKSLLDAKMALVREQRMSAEQDREERRKALEMEQEERRAQRKQEADCALATTLFTELARSNRPLEEVKSLIDYFFQRQGDNPTLG
ncbi:hypothetical protein R1sor_004839 [Riccia sorocarpa]|uniref:Uncharacterized protein n=1 Tax=Riccia sorocarpa TaxID=122646 RepID=A0ABD3HHS7_9MARC